MIERGDVVDEVARLIPGHAEAVGFVAGLLDVIYVWDDLIDRDKPVAAEAVNGAFCRLLVSLPANPFYRRYFDALHPLISAAIVSWLTANTLEASDDEGLDKQIAFIVRSDYLGVVAKVLELCRGFDFAVAAMPALRRYVHEEGFAAYCQALANEQREG